MIYKIFIPILILITIISTLCICLNKPQMHKSIFVYNSDYKIQLEQNKSAEVQTKDIPTIEITTTKLPASVKNIEISTDNSNVKIQTNNVKTNAQTKISDAKIKNTKINMNSPKVKVNTPQLEVQNTSAKVQSNNVKTAKPQIDVQKILENNKKIQTENQKNDLKTKTPAPTPIKNTTQKIETIAKITPAPAPTNVKTVQIAPEPVKVLTPSEEEIAWNIWRSNLQNKIMNDVKLPAAIPHGTIFRYKFDLDKYGKITNLKTWSDNPSYTPYAIQFMAPVIKSYQGRSILNFPQGSKRITTEAWGAWKISNRTIYSTPNDYNDIERIKK